MNMLESIHTCSYTNLQMRINMIKYKYDTNKKQFEKRNVQSNILSILKLVPFNNTTQFYKFQHKTT